MLGHKTYLKNFKKITLKLYSMKMAFHYLYRVLNNKSENYFQQKQVNARET